MHCPLMHAVHTTTRHIVHTVPPHNGNASGHVLHLPHVQKRAGGGFLSRFDAIHAPPPPLHAKASRRWTFIVFPRRAHHVHLPRMQTRAGGGFIAFRRHSRVLHLPCMQKRAGGGFRRHFCVLHLPRVQ